MKTATIKESGPESVANLLDTLGRALLNEGLRDWVDMDAAAIICKRHGIQVNATCPSSSELESTLREFFKDQEEFYAPGLNVDGYTRRVGWEDLFQLRAYPHGLIQPNPVDDLKSAAKDIVTDSKAEKQPESPGEWATEIHE
jgi:hypothetical protein